MVGIPVTIASRFVTIINVIPIKTIGMISQISVYPKLLPSIAAVGDRPGADHNSRCDQPRSNSFYQIL